MFKVKQSGSLWGIGGNVNMGAGNGADVLFVNGGTGDASRVFTASPGSLITVKMEVPPKGPNLAGFVLYVIQREAGFTDPARQPYSIGFACMPMPLSKGFVSPPPFSIANSIGYFSLLGFPILHWIGPAPCTVFKAPFPPGTYTLQGYILDGGAASLIGMSLTNAVVVKVQ